MNEKSCVAIVIWMFAVAVVYAFVALPPLFRTTFLQWLVFYALLMAPVFFMEFKRDATAAKEKES